MNVQDLLDDFEFLDDWEDRYRFLIELGRGLPILAESAYTDTNKVRGCTSQVWMVMAENADQTLGFKGDSDAHIVKGLVAVLLLIYSDKAREVILATDAKALLGQLQLSEHLSPMRTNGLFSMVNRINEMAATAC